mgnify:CR=1 FL=1
MSYITLLGLYFFDFLIVKLNFGTGAWACLDTRAARLRLAADKPTHRPKQID